MKLYKHQQNIVDKNPLNTLLCWDTGTGKSLAALELAIKNGGSTLIICPKSLKDKWHRDIEEHKNTKDGTWDVLTKEEFKKIYKDLIGYNNLIVDEAHYFAGPKSQMSNALYNYIRKNNCRVWLLTATPYLSTPWNIFTLSRHLGKDWNYLTFKERFFQINWIGKRAITVPRDDIEDDIAALVSSLGDVVRLDECVEVPPQIFEREDFKLNSTQKTKIKETQETNAIVRFTKHHEIENGFLISDGYKEDEYFINEKNPRIADYVKEHDKIAIVCRYNLQIESIKTYLGPLKKPIYIINGATKSKDAIIQEIEKEEECIVLINASCSEGYELPSIGIILFASLSFSYKDYKQMMGRFLRINKLKKNVYIHMVVSGGIDEAVYDSMMKKKDFNIKIYEKNNIS